jgi:hypothetical protein
MFVGHQPERKKHFIKGPGGVPQEQEDPGSNPARV